jgi:putative nucleotidyltransferase with HDIG domain
MIPAYVLVERVEALPTLPEAVARLSAMLRDESASAADFETAVRPDPAVTANLLRAANSAFDRGMGRVGTVREAVARIGLRRVFEVAIGTSLRRSLPVRIPGYGLDAPSFWLHCTATAVFAEALGREAKLASMEIAFTAGLLHDVGKLIIGQFLAEETPESNWWTFGAIAAERELLGSDHARVGEEIAARWRLPPLIGEVCRWHHEPFAAPGREEIDLAAAVKAADALAYRVGFPGGPRVDESIAPEVEARLGLTVDRMVQLAEASKDEVRRMSDLTSS